VDLDLRHPTLAELFGIAKRARMFGLRLPPGVVDVVLDRASLDEALIPVDLPTDARSSATNGHLNGGVDRSLSLLQAGSALTNVGDLVQSRRFGDLIAALRSRADVVLIDSPPLLGIGDGVALSRHVDALLVVVRHGSTRRSTLAELRRVLDTCPVRKLGFVLTNTEPSATYGDGADYSLDRPPVPSNAE
jgi:Mrp family chromosome partitioning ATPase